MKYRMKMVCGHIEVLDENGEFLFSADTVKEAEEDISALSA